MRKREEIIDVIADVYEEQKINKFGIDSFSLCEKMGIKLVKYSEYSEKKHLLIKRDEDGFSNVDFIKNSIIIFYNDEIRPYRRLKFTIFHELGHIFLGHHQEGKDDETEEQKKEADIFANEFYCPQAFMIYYDIRTKKELMDVFKITEKYAEVLIDKLSKRKTMNLSKNEKRLIRVFENNKK